MLSWESALDVVRSWDGRVRTAVISGQLCDIQGDPTDLLRWMRGANPVWIAAMSGAVSGSATAVVAACRIRIADTSVMLGGRGSGTAGFDLPAAVTTDVELTGRGLGAQECLRWGVVSRLCDPGELDAMVDTVVEEICSAVSNGSPTNTAGLSTA